MNDLSFVGPGNLCQYCYLTDRYYNVGKEIKAMPIAEKKSDTRHIELSVLVPDNVDPAMEKTLSEAAEKVLATLANTDTQARLLELADTIAGAVVGTIQPDPYLVGERIDRLKSIRKIMEEGQWLTAAEINAAQDAPPAQKSLPASDWKRRGRIFSVNYNGTDYYPRYGLDSSLRPLPIISQILKEFEGEPDSWKIAAWFHFPNGYVSADTPDGRRPVAPRDALNQPDKVLQAARARKGTYIA